MIEYIERNGKVLIEFSTGNAAFDDDAEVPRILRAIASKIEGGMSFGAVWDTNGNAVGKYRFTREVY